MVRQRLVWFGLYFISSRNPSICATEILSLAGIRKYFAHSLSDKKKGPPELLEALSFALNS